MHFAVPLFFYWLNNANCFTVDISIFITITSCTGSSTFLNGININWLWQGILCGKHYETSNCLLLAEAGSSGWLLKIRQASEGHCVEKWTKLRVLQLRLHRAGNKTVSLTQKSHIHPSHCLWLLSDGLSLCRVRVSPSSADILFFSMVLGWSCWVTVPDHPLSLRRLRPTNVHFAFPSFRFVPIHDVGITVFIFFSFSALRDLKLRNVKLL